MDLGARIAGDESPGGPHCFDEPRREIAGLRRANGPERPLAVARHRGRHLRLHAGLDHHDLGAFAEPAHEPGRAGPRASNREGETSCAFIDAEVSRTTTTLRAPCPMTVTTGRARASGQREERQELEEEQGVAVQPLEERRGLAVADRGAPQKQARRPSARAGAP